jgi:hypothetical protein
VHSGVPQTCQPIPFFSSLGYDGSGQGSDFFAKTNGCTVEPLPMAPSGRHACNGYMSWCDATKGVELRETVLAS